MNLLFRDDMEWVYTFACLTGENIKINNLDDKRSPTKSQTSLVKLAEVSYFVSRDSFIDFLMSYFR
jgi:hypothetical protein